MIIYCTTNLITFNKYIGQDAHNNPKYLGSGTILKKAIKKYGNENFKKEILQYCKDIDDLNESEKYWIDYFSAVKSNLFYNILPGGNPKNFKIKQPQEVIKKRIKSREGYCHTKETIEKIKNANPQKREIICYNLEGKLLYIFKSIGEARRELKPKGSIGDSCKRKTKCDKYMFRYSTGEIISQISPYKHSLKGVKRDKSIIDKIANSNKGKKRNQEQCFRIGNANRGRVQTIEEKNKRSESHKIHNKLHPRSLEHIRKNAEAQYVRIFQYDLQGNLIKEHISLKHAAEYIGVGRPDICFAAKNKKIYKNFLFSYTKILKK